MDGVGGAVQRLQRLHRAHRPRDGSRVEHAPLRHRARHPRGFFQAVDAAQPAAGRPGEAALARGQSRQHRRGQFHAQLDAARVLQHLQRGDFRRGLDDALGQREAGGEVLQVGRRAHHHRVGFAVEGDGERGFLGDVARLRGRGRAVAPDVGDDGAVSGDHLAAQPFPPAPSHKGRRKLPLPLREMIGVRGLPPTVNPPPPPGSAGSAWPVHISPATRSARCWARPARR